jgi:hypothetical protein
MFHVPNQFRVRKGSFGSDDSIGNYGLFFIPNRAAKTRGLSTREYGAVPLKVIASEGEGWEHVSVSLPTRCPTWEEMSFIKSLFWDDVDCVVQFHPPSSEHVNNHAFCLHLWRPIGYQIQTPPSILVGDKSLGTLALDQL